MLDLTAVTDIRNQTALIYQNHDVIHQEVEKRLIDKLQFIQYQPKVLVELGCSSGRFAQQLGQHYTNLDKYIGYDIARQRLPLSDQQYQFYLHHTPDEIPLEDSSVDMIIANLYWHWVEDIAGLFQTIKRILSPGGLLVFSAFGVNTLSELKQAWRAIDDQAHVQNFDDMHDLGDLVLQTGFADPVLYNETITIEYQKLSTLFSDIKGQGATYCGHDRMRHCLSRQAYQRLLDTYPQGENCFPASFEIIYGQAWQSLPSNKASVNGDGEVKIDISSIGRRAAI